MNRYRIFEYTAPFPDNSPRWIGARSREAADKHAERKGWRLGNEIHVGSLTVPQDRKGLKLFGCDAILED